MSFGNEMNNGWKKVNCSWHQLHPYIPDPNVTECGCVPWSPNPNHDGVVL